MPDELLDNELPGRLEPEDPDAAENTSGGQEVIPTVIINRSSLAELDRRRMLHLQTMSLLILASAAVITLIYLAKLILVVILVSILLSFVLAPVVDGLSRFHVPHTVASLLAVLALVTVGATVTYVSSSRALDFAHQLPQYKARIQALVGQVRGQAEDLEKATEAMLPANAEDKNTITVKESNNWTDMVSRNASAVSELILTVTFVPFLVFFMLSWQDHVRATSVMLFSMENRNTAYVMLGLIARMIRSFIVGNFIIGVFLSVFSIALFAALGLPYFYFVGVISGFLSLIPYLGVLLAMAPPLIVGLGQLTPTMFFLVVCIVLGLHLVAMNVLYPKVLGKRLQLNPLAVTIALLFWGWLWGAAGLILAVPIMGACKIICDHIDRLRPYGAWLGE